MEQLLWKFIDQQEREMKQAKILSPVFCPRNHLGVVSHEAVNDFMVCLYDDCDVRYENDGLVEADLIFK